MDFVATKKTIKHHNDCYFMRKKRNLRMTASFHKHVLPTPRAYQFSLFYIIFNYILFLTFECLPFPHPLSLLLIGLLVKLNVLTIELDLYSWRARTGTRSTLLGLGPENAKQQRRQVGLDNYSLILCICGLFLDIFCSMSSLECGILYASRSVFLCRCSFQEEHVLIVKKHFHTLVLRRGLWLTKKICLFLTRKVVTNLGLSIGRTWRILTSDWSLKSRQIQLKYVFLMDIYPFSSQVTPNYFL